MGLAGAGFAAAAASLAGAAISAYGSTSAASTQAHAENTATNLQRDIFNKEQSNFSPFISTGTNALGLLSSIYGLPGSTPLGSNGLTSMLQNYPGYQFAQQQGNIGLDRSQAARGLLTSGGTVKDALSYNQGLASQQWTNYLSGIGNLASLGQASAAGAAATGTQAATGIAQTTAAAGAALGAGTVGATNAISGGLTSGTNNALLMYGLGNNPNGPFGTSFTGGKSGTPMTFGGSSNPGIYNPGVFNLSYGGE